MRKLSKQEMVKEANRYECDCFMVGVHKKSKKLYFLWPIRPLPGFDAVYNYGHVYYRDKKMPHIGLVYKTVGKIRLKQISTKFELVEKENENGKKTKTFGNQTEIFC